MTHRDSRSFLADERDRFVSYVRSLLTESRDLDAEDIVHDVLVRILEKADTASPLDHLAAYVYRSLRNRVIDHARARKTLLSLEGSRDGNGGRLVDLLSDVRPNALAALQTREGREELFEALSVLRPAERDVIVAHELEGATFKELSQAWDVPLNTLLSHKARGMKKLKRYFLGS